MDKNCCFILRRRSRLHGMANVDKYFALSTLKVLKKKELYVLTMYLD